MKVGPVAQLVRAPPCHGGGREFESLLGRLYRKVQDINLIVGIIAQLGEHLPYKQGVIGSSPIGPIATKVAKCRSGGTGRRTGLKILRDLYSRTGSIPVCGIFIFERSVEKSALLFLYPPCEYFIAVI